MSLLLYQLSYRPILFLCDSVGARSQDLLFRRELLYPTELRNHPIISEPEGIQTLDLQNRNLMLYSAKLRVPLQYTLKELGGKEKRSLRFALHYFPLAILVFRTSISLERR